MRKAVGKIEAKEKTVNFKLRFAAVIFLIALAAGAFVYGIYSYFYVAPGWTQIKAEASAEINCGDDFIFLYNLGAGKNSAADDSKRVTEIFTGAVVKAYRLFNAGESFDGVKNIRYINEHPNETVKVDSLLYHALEKITENDIRNIYLGPVYQQYDNLFYCTEDSEAENYDPERNKDIRSYFDELLVYANDSDMISIELLGENNVRLKVADEYIKYADENKIDVYIDFFWMKNAFITDYIADSLQSEGYTFGSVSSYDGFIRNLDGSGETYSLNIYDRVGYNVYGAGTYNYSGGKSIVCFRDYAMNSRDDGHYFEYSDGTLKSPYISPKDGVDKAAVASLTACSDSKNCAEIMLDVMEYYIADSWNESDVISHRQSDTDYIFCRDGRICHTEKNPQFSQLFEDENKKYTTEYVE